MLTTVEQIIAAAHRDL